MERAPVLLELDKFLDRSPLKFFKLLLLLDFLNPISEFLPKVSEYLDLFSLLNVGPLFG